MAYLAPEDRNGGEPKRNQPSRKPQLPFCVQNKLRGADDALRHLSVALVSRVNDEVSADTNDISVITDRILKTRDRMYQTIMQEAKSSRALVRSEDARDYIDFVTNQERINAMQLMKHDVVRVPTGKGLASDLIVGEIPPAWSADRANVQELQHVR